MTNLLEEDFSFKHAAEVFDNYGLEYQTKEIQRLQNKLLILAAAPPRMPSKRRPTVLAEIKARLDKFMFEVFGL